MELRSRNVREWTTKYPMENKTFLSVVIPAYKEENNINKGTPQKVLSYLKRQKYTWEVLFVDDGSPDKTADLLEKFAKKEKRVRVIKNPHQGKGATVVTGMLAAAGDIVLFTDMDQATPLSEVEKFLPYFSQGYDIVIGSRKGREGAPLIRKIMAFGFVILRTLVLRLPFSDTQVGFKAFRGQVSRAVFKNLKIFGQKREIKTAAVKAGFDLEVLYVARKLGFKIKEVPVAWQHQGSMRVSPLRDSLDGLQDLLRIRWYALKGEYDGKT